MTTSSRSRKPAADAPTSATPDTDAPEASTPVPAAAPLEPPTEAAPDPLPTQLTEVERVPVAEALPEVINGLIIDSDTRQPPTDLDTVFERVTPHGTTVVSTIRLVENQTDPYGRTRTTLLTAQGAQLSTEAAQLIMQRLRDQADARHAINQ
ncbi:hypothetical protein [Kitasatospora sp. NPDC090091]|uniref:hypothetical protein n=1 Tax=Kitasatospora sp. NPDC090091 TaxID=3364081 RepID=UPI00381E2F04